MSATAPAVNQTSPAEASRVTVPRIAFRAHQALPWLLLPHGIPAQLLMDATPVRVPNTRPWFQGMVSQRGNLLPVFDLGHWAGLPEQTGVRPYVVAIGIGAQSCAMHCIVPPTLLLLGQQTRSDIADDGTLSPYLHLSFDSPSGMAREFDIQRWLAVAAQQFSSNA